MRTLLATIGMVAVAAATASAQSGSAVAQLVQDGASVSAYGSGPEGSYNLNAWATTRRGPDGMSEVYVYFNVGRRVGPESWESIWGSGYVPGSVLKVTGNSVQLQIADLTVVSGYFLMAQRCDMFNCYEVPLPDTFPVDVVFTPGGRYSEQRQGVTRRHTEFDWLANASVDVVEVGSSTQSNALVAGVFWTSQLESDFSYMSDGWIGQSRGTTITIERTSAR